MKYKINKGFISEKLDGKTVIFDSDSGMFYTFNETAAFIFKKIKSGNNEEEIVNKVIKKYQVKAEKAKKDLIDLFADLKKKKIISSK